MKNLKKMFCLLLTMMMLSSLMMTASAASTLVPPPPTTSADESQVDKPDAASAETELTGESDPIVAPTPTAPLTVVAGPRYNYLYWINYLGEQPEIVYDEGTAQGYLAFRLSDASKLAQLMYEYKEAFALQHNLELLKQSSDVDVAIWQKSNLFEPEQAIGDLLSKSTVTALKAMGEIDAYEALKFIQTRSEYKTNETLSGWVDYQLAILKWDQVTILNGLYQLDSNSREVTVTEVTTTPADTIELTERFLENHPEMGVLAEAYELAMSGYTSNYMTTFHTDGADRIAELWDEVCEATSECWSGKIYYLNNFVFAVPFSEGTVYKWPNLWEKPVTSTEEPMLPGPSTGG